MNYFDIKTPVTELKQYLVSNNWMQADEQILSVEKPGEGNMNVVLRFKTNKRSFILKQSRPFVQKYQQIEAPLNRIAVEHEFYQAIQNESLRQNMPSILGYDEIEHLLILEDLGHCQDMSSIYAAKQIDENQLRRLTSILAAIHESEVPNSFPENMAMRQLNHQHIFVLPFLEDNGFQLDNIQEGLQEISMQFKQDTALKAIVKKVGAKYLSPGNTLLHGDYYPGSWMTETENLYVIDPEFGFVGFAEFDLGVMAAHVVMATSDESYLHSIFNSYHLKADKTLMTQVAGIEIMRRLIGLAQLPLDRSIKEKQYLLELAQKMILS
ncbi:MAG: phosphotransferase [Maribacter sp.]